MRSTFSDETKTVGTLDLNEAKEDLRIILLEEIGPYINDIKKKNPHISDEDIITRYLSFLRRIKDPFIDTLDDINAMKIAKSEVDQAIDVVIKRKQVRNYILQCLENGSGEEAGLGLNVRTGNQLRNSCIHVQDNKREIIDTLSLKNRKYLDILIYTIVLGKSGLMVGELIPELQSYIEDFYTSIEELSNGIMSGDQSLAFMIISIFGYEAIVKIREVGFLSYIKNNKTDTLLNIFGLVEGGNIVQDIIIGENNQGIASTLRSFRAFRLLQVMGKMKGVKDIFDAISEASPGVVKITGIYTGVSLVTMIMLTQLTKGHITELSTLGGALNEMRNLFYADGFQDVLGKIEGSETMDTIPKVLASGIANLYQLGSSTFYFAIPTALFADVVNKSGKTAEKIASLTLERVDEVLRKSG